MAKKSKLRLLIEKKKVELQVERDAFKLLKAESEATIKSLELLIDELEKADAVKVPKKKTAPQTI